MEIYTGRIKKKQESPKMSLLDYSDLCKAIFSVIWKQIPKSYQNNKTFPSRVYFLFKKDKLDSEFSDT